MEGSQEARLITEEPVSPLARHGLHHRSIAFFWFLAASLGAFNAWTTRHFMNPDGISYLDMGDAYLHGDWATAINAYWSPLYSWLLGAGMLILKPTPFWEFPVVHLINFIVYLAALASFHFFLVGLIRFRRERMTKTCGGKGVIFLEWSLIASGYALFIWSSLKLLRIATPDLCVSAFVYLISGVILRIKAGATRWPMFVLLGISLGFAYLSKAAMLPMGFVFLSTCLYPVDKLRASVLRVLVALLVFLSVVSPFIVALSTTKGRLTFGDSARLNYSWYTGIPHRHWQGEPPGGGKPLHPTRKIFDEPSVYEFRTPIGGAYPPWFDPTYWYEGVAPSFSFIKQARILVSNAKIYRRLLFPYLAVLCIGLFLLRFGSKRAILIKGISNHWNLIFPAIAAISMYWLVHVELRFIGAFLVIFWMGLVSGMIDNRPEGRPMLQGSIIASMALVMITAAIVSAAESPCLGSEKDGSGCPASANAHWSVAEGLNRLGIQRGDRVGVIGWGTAMAPWARLARVSIISEIPEGPSLVPDGPSFRDGEKFWRADEGVKVQVINAIANTGAKAIVAKKIPNSASAGTWRRIGETDFYVHFLR